MACGVRSWDRFARLLVYLPSLCRYPSSCLTSTISTTVKLTKRKCNPRTSTTSPVAPTCPGLWVNPTWVSYIDKVEMLFFFNVYHVIIFITFLFCGSKRRMPLELLVMLFMFYFTFMFIFRTFRWEGRWQRRVRQWPLTKCYNSVVHLFV